MSIFSETTIKETSDIIIEKYYILEWDFVRGKKIKKGLFPRKLDNSISYLDHDKKEVYYNPGWLFYFYLSVALAYARQNARGFRGEFKLSDLDESNLRYRFKNMTKDCGMLKYKSSNYILADPYNNAVSSLKSQIVDMMYNYITKETNKSRYFKHIK
jgi:hypothetical protein